MSHPYENLPARAFWRSAVAGPGPDGIRDVASCKNPLRPEDVIATAGSCFAQHISRRLKAQGFRYLDAEPPPSRLPEALHGRFGYGLFSARYGNIYTSTQLLQLIRRAGGQFTPRENLWERDGRWYDPFRPGTEPNGFASAGEALASQAAHLRAVRGMVRRMDVFIFTLGLTETWRSKEDGAVYPVCPGVVAGTFDPERHEFVNLDYETILGEMKQALGILRRAKPTLRVLLTVSPVPLTATASGEHVLTATTYSKSVLRAVAGRLTELYDWVDYFPSYELVTAPVFAGRAYAPNWREIASTGVDFVMEAFLREFCSTDAVESAPPPLPRRKRRGAETGEDEDVVCDEMALGFYAP